MEKSDFRFPQNIIDNWRDIDLEAFKFAFERGLLKFNEVLEESETITERTSKLIATFFVFVIVIIGSSYKDTPHGLVIALEIALGIIDVILFCFLLFGVKVVLRGTAPRFLLPESLLEEQKENQLKLIYYQEITRMQRGLEINRANVSEKRKWYLYALVVSLIMFIVGGIIIVLNISNIILP